MIKLRHLMEWKNKFSRPLLVGLLIAGVAFSFGRATGEGMRPTPLAAPINLVNQSAAQPAEVDFAPFWQAWRLIDERFVDPNATTTTDSGSAVASPTQKRVWGAIGGLVDSLGDPYTVFLPPAENQAFEEEIRGNFGGVGMEVGMRDGRMTVIAPLKDTPAARAGILAGDRILEIDGESTVKLPLDEAIGLIRGEVGTTVKLKISRGEKNEIKDLAVVRAVINVPTIETELLPRPPDGGTGVFLIKFYNFGGTASTLFRRALREFVAAKTNKLIIDLRGNPGGYLEAAVETASWFLPAGAVVAIEDKGRDAEPTVYKSRGYDVFTEKLKLVILVDRGSASASEIFAGALREHGRATLVGEQTFGKGSVQELVPLDDNGALKITIARWLTPHGVSISHDGLKPDLAVAQKAEAEKYSPTDLQLAKAVEILQK